MLNEDLQYHHPCVSDEQKIRFYILATYESEELTIIGIYGLIRGDCLNRWKDSLHSTGT